jgi:hypothetical protein
LLLGIFPIIYIDILRINGKHLKSLKKTRKKKVVALLRSPKPLDKNTKCLLEFDFF